MVSVELRPEALQDIVQSATWWEDVDAGLGERYVAAVEHGTNLLLKQPFLGPLYKRRFRRLLVMGFHQGIFYRVRDNRVEVLAVLDLRGDPRKIARTVGERA